MYAGQIVEVGATRQLYHDPAHPYTAGLLAANPQRALELTGAGLTRLPSIPGAVPPPQDWPAGCHFQERCPLVSAECRSSSVPLVVLGDGRRSRCVHADALRASEAGS
jgi:peptide/nickel transport system permease protein